jgi:hypothetical protein
VSIFHYQNYKKIGCEYTLYEQPILLLDKNFIELKICERIHLL